MEWISTPMKIVDKLFEDSGNGDVANYCQYFSERLSADSTALHMIPSLNDVKSEVLIPNSLVRFRCMVQDIFNPELCLQTYRLVNKSTNEVSNKLGLFRDVIDCPLGFEIVECFENDSMRPIDRQALYCIPVPGESQWVKDEYRNLSANRPMAPVVSSSGCASKRSLEDDDEVDSEAQSGVLMVVNGEGDSIGPKRVKQDAENGDAKKEVKPNFNFPLPNEKGPACLIKVYDSSEDIKVNDILEVVGILSIDPAMASFNEENCDIEELADVASALRCSDEERAALNPPPSLVPRIHAVHVRHLSHVNPLVAQTSLDVTAFKRNALEVRDQMLAVLEKALFGDSLAAEYLLCHLVSHIYSRMNVVALGKFSLNLTRCFSGYAEKLYALLSEILTKSYYLPLSLSNMNDLKFTPHKDYTANKLVTGLLQLPAGMHLILDEIALESGKLEATGVQNMTALGNVINWQKLDYDFNFHQQSFPTDISTLIISEGKSILKTDCQMPLILAAQPNDETLAATFNGIREYLTPSLLNQIRSYITMSKLVEYSLDNDMQKKVEEDFVEIRRVDADNLSVDDFHTLLTLARLLSVTYGHTTLTSEVWQAAKEMEASRKLRLSATTASRI